MTMPGVRGQTVITLTPETIEELMTVLFPGLKTCFFCKHEFQGSSKKVYVPALKDHKDVHPGCYQARKERFITKGMISTVSA